jgi:hypothetical protein
MYGTARENRKPDRRSNVISNGDRASSRRGTDVSMAYWSVRDASAVACGGQEAQARAALETRAPSRFHRVRLGDPGRADPSALDDCESLAVRSRRSVARRAISPPISAVAVAPVTSTASVARHLRPRGRRRRAGSSSQMQGVRRPAERRAEDIEPPSDGEAGEDPVLLGHGSGSPRSRSYGPYRGGDLACIARWQGAHWGELQLLAIA